MFRERISRFCPQTRIYFVRVTAIATQSGLHRKRNLQQHRSNNDDLKSKKSTQSKLTLPTLCVVWRCGGVVAEPSRSSRLRCLGPATNLPLAGINNGVASTQILQQALWRRIECFVTDGHVKETGSAVTAWRLQHPKSGMRSFDLR